MADGHCGGRRFGRTAVALGIAAAVLLAPLCVGTGSAQQAGAETTSDPSTLAMCADQYRHSATFALLGDSHSRGSGASAEQFTWAAQLQYVMKPQGVRIDNQSTLGAMARDYAPGGRFFDRTTSVASTRPSLVTIQFGTNEWWNAVPPEQYRDSLQQIVDYLHANTPRSTIMIVHMPRAFSGPAVANPHAQGEYHDVQWSLAQREGTEFLNLEVYYPSAPKYDFHHLYAPDGEHLSDLGQLVEFDVYHQKLTATCGISG